MIVDSSIKLLVGKKVDQVILKMWPPFLEESLAFTDLSVAFRFENYGYLYFTTDEDNYSLCIKGFEDIEICQKWELFDDRVNKWLSGDLTEINGYEYYDFTKHPDFDGITSNEVKNIQFLYVGDDAKPFGVKFVFKDDFFISVSGVDGNTIETKKFNKSDVITPFLNLGEIKFVDIS